MGPSPLEMYLAEISACTTADDLFVAFRKEMRLEGFENISFLKYSPAGDHELPMLDVPDHFAHTYLASRFIDDDPVITLLGQKKSAFTWSQMMSSRPWSKKARNVMENCRELGVMNGVSIPFYGPEGNCDVFSLSFRSTCVFEPARLPIVSMKTYSCWRRFQEITSAEQVMVRCGFQAASGDAQADHSEACGHHAEGFSGISAEECRALVLTDVAYRRYQAGLTELNDALHVILGQDVYDRLQERGLIYEEPDDDRFRFIAKPSPIARSHLKSCQAVAQIRESVWRLNVRPDERPIN